jgi:hypothetical protein
VQQIIWQLFNAVKKGFAASGNTNKAFLAGLLPHLSLHYHNAKYPN